MDGLKEKSPKSRKKSSKPQTLNHSNSIHN